MVYRIYIQNTTYADKSMGFYASKQKKTGSRSNANRSFYQANTHGTPLTTANRNQQASFRPPPIYLPSSPIQTKGDSSAKDTAAEGAGAVNSAGNIIGGIMDVVAGHADEAMKVAGQLAKDAKAAKALADARAASALANAKRAGSGKSILKSAQAAKAQKAANVARAAAAAKTAKAAKSMRQATKLLKALPKFAKVLKKLPLDALGGVASFTAKGLTSHNQTKTGKIVDATATAGIDVLFGKRHPIVAAVDAVVGLAGGDRVTISETMSDSVSSITSVGEGIATGDTRAMSSFHEASKKGENTWFFQKAAETGEEYGEYSEDRVKTTGDFWGGADTKLGRSTAFLSAVPGIGDVGEGIGVGTGIAVKNTVKAGKSIEKKLNKHGLTADPRDWEFDPRKW